MIVKKQHIIFFLTFFILMLANINIAKTQTIKNCIKERIYTSKHLHNKVFFSPHSHQHSQHDSCNIDYSSSDNEDSEKDYSNSDTILKIQDDDFLYWYLYTSTFNNKYADNYTGIVISLHTPPPQY